MLLRAKFPCSVVAISRERELLTFLSLEEGVGQGDGVDPSHPRVIVELRVDVEEDGHVDLLVGIETLLLEAETLDLVEVLSRIKRHHVVGGDADDGFVCRVLGPVKGQRRFTWNHIDLCLLRSEVPLDAGMRVGVEGNFDNALLHRFHRLHLICIMASDSRAAQSRCLAVEAVKGNSSIGQSNHPHAGSSDVCQHSLVPGPPLLFLTPGPSVETPRQEARRKPPAKVVFSLGTQEPPTAAVKGPDASRQRMRDGRTQQKRQRHRT